MQRLDPHRTTWHITFGTYGTRLPGGSRPTVDRRQNKRGEPFITPDPCGESRAKGQMRDAPVYFTAEQQAFVQEIIPSLCERGGWRYRTCAAAANHIHILLDADSAVHGERVRRLLKRWLTQALDEHFARPGATWWARQGSNIPVQDESYLRNAWDYIERQRS